MDFSSWPTWTISMRKDRDSSGASSVWYLPVARRDCRLWNMAGAFWCGCWLCCCVGCCWCWCLSLCILRGIPPVWHNNELDKERAKGRNASFSGSANNRSSNNATLWFLISTRTSSAIAHLKPMVNGLVCITVFFRFAPYLLWNFCLLGTSECN